MKQSVVLFFCSFFIVVGLSIQPIEAQLSDNVTSPRVAEDFLSVAVNSIVEDKPKNRKDVEIIEVRVSSDGLYAMVTWILDPAGGETLMRNVDGEIQIVEEGGGALRQSDLETIGIPPDAAAEIVSEWGRDQ